MRASPTVLPRIAGVHPALTHRVTCSHPPSAASGKMAPDGFEHRA